MTPILCCSLIAIFNVITSKYTEKCECGVRTNHDHDIGMFEIAKYFCLYFFFFVAIMLRPVSTYIHLHVKRDDNVMGKANTFRYINIKYIHFHPCVKCVHLYTCTVYTRHRYIVFSNVFITFCLPPIWSVKFHTSIVIIFNFDGSVLVEATHRRYHILCKSLLFA